MRFKAVLIDLDGTLLDTIADIAAAANAMQHDLGLPPMSPESLTSYVGKGSENMVARLLAKRSGGATPDAAELAEALAIFLRHYRKLNGVHAQPYPGVRAGLEAFRQAGIKMAVVTNKLTEFTLPLLASTGLADFFDAVVCGDTCARKKPDPLPFQHACALLGVAPAEALVIGDSVNDAQAARAAGASVVVVPYGYNEGIDVRTLDVDDIVSSIESAARWAAQAIKQPEQESDLP